MRLNKINRSRPCFFVIQVGSQKKETFKMKTSNIKYFIELNQVGLIEDGGPLWAHSDPVSRSKGTINKVLLNNVY